MNKIIIFALVAVISCDNKDIDEKKEIVIIDDSICKRAQDHIKDCLDLEAEISGECDEKAAESILEMSCENLEISSEDIKSDGYSWLDKMHCRIGVLHFCKVPVCEEVEVLDSCIEAIDLNECGQCAYYNCLESKAQCGEDGYLINFVGKYCDRFTQITRPRLSEFGKVWLDGVRECLIYNMEEDYYEGESCESIEDRGIEDHISCYVDTGICSLPAGDWLKILGTIKPHEFPLFQALSVGNKCIKDFLGL